MANYRKLIKPVRELDCPRETARNEIVVCGRQAGEAQRERLPLPVAPTPGEHTRLAPGEAPRGDVGRTPAYCFSRCPGVVGIDLDMAKKIVSGVKRVLEGDE